MAAVIAHRTCARWLRRQFPERHALKNRLHYLLTRQRGFALWQDADGKLIAGYAVWQQQKPATHNLAGVEKLPKREELAETVASIFNYLNAPVEFDELVSSVAAIQGISDQPVESLTDDEDAVNEPVAPEPDQAVHTTEIRNTDSLPAHSPSTLIRLALRILVHAKRVSQ